MKLSDWAAQQGVHYQTAWRWRKRGALPVPARQLAVEHRDRLARLGVEHLQAALTAQGRRIVVADDSETTDDLVGDMVEVLTGLCVRRDGRRGARSRALRAVAGAKRSRSG